MMICDLLVLYLFAAALMDITFMRVGNLWIVFGLLSGFLFNLMYGNLFLFFSGFFCALPLLMLYRAGVMGAGDIKLFMVTGCFTGGIALYRIFVLSLSFMGGLIVFLFCGKALGRRGRNHIMPAAAGIFLGVVCYRIYFFS